MRRHRLYWAMALAITGAMVPRLAHAQAATIDTGLPPAPGGMNATLGAAPGSGASSLGNSPGAGASTLSAPPTAGNLGGRPGVSQGRSPTSISTPNGNEGGNAPSMGITAPQPQPTPPVQLYGSLELVETDDEGPPNGTTLDQAIDRIIRENLDLRSKFFEIPQAQADILNANLRANPVFYADSQLVPYGKFNRSNPGGPTQYDVNISYPLDISRKRRARTQYASAAKRVIEAQYQDAVRNRLDDLYSAFVDVLAARQTVRYSRKSVSGLKELYTVTYRLYESDQNTRADVNRVVIQLNQAEVGLLDAEESLRKANRALGALLNVPPAEAETLQVRGAIQDLATPPPPMEELVQSALAIRPDLVSYRLGVQSAEANVRLQLANRFTDVYLLYQPYTLQNNQPYGLKSPISWAVGVTVPLPIYNRNQGGIERAKLNVTQTQTELATLERQVITDVHQAVKEYDLTRRMVQQIHDVIEPAAKQVRNDALRLYMGGEANVTYYLTAQREYNDTVKLYLDSVIRHRRSMLALNTVLAQRILP